MVRRMIAASMLSSSMEISSVVGGCGSSLSIKSRAVASAVDAYATRLLRSRSCPSAGVDPSLGPYVTSLLRRAQYGQDMLAELLEDHCSMSREVALETLETLSLAVETGVVPTEDSNAMSLGGRRSHRSVSMGNEHDYYGHLDAIRLLGGMLADSGIGYDNPVKVIHEENQHDATNHDDTTNTSNDVISTPTSSKGKHRTPLKPDRLIPVDLLGEIDHPSYNDGETVAESPPPVLVSSPVKTKHDKPKDLAACLFRPSRPRANSVACIPEPQKLTHTQHSMELRNKAQLNSTVSLLMTMNYGLSEEAAQEAALVSHADVNLAQHVIDQALNAPPVCRHMLNDACYRSDCQFSHDVEGHTCVFWLRGKCGKPNCKFLHGFSKSTLDGVPSNYLATPTQSKPIQTTNLLEHNMQRYNSNSSTSSANLRCVPALSSSPLFLSSSLDAFTPTNLKDNNTYNSNFANSLNAHNDTDTITTSSSSTSSSLSSSLPSRGDGAETQTNTSASNNTNTNTINQTNNKPVFSFAKIATKGYNQTRSFSKPDNNNNSPTQNSTNPKKSQITTKKSPPLSKQNPLKAKYYKHNPNHNQSKHNNVPVKTKVVKIPQDLLWNVNPKRKDVIDMHMQTIHTFASFLSTLLPEKLQKYNSVWLLLHKCKQLDMNTVLQWFHSTSKHYEVLKGKDMKALCVKRKQPHSPTIHNNHR